MDKIIFIDPLSEGGHQNFNNNFINFFKDKYRVIYCSDSHKIRVFEEKNVFDSALLSKNNSFLYKVRQFFILFKSIFIIKDSGSPYLIFLSYELVSFSFFSHFLRILFPEKKIYVVEHNTFCPNNYLKLMFFRGISKKVKHICLSEFIEEEISKQGKKTIFITHPFGFCDKSFCKPTINMPVKKSDVFSFMPSSNIGKDILTSVENMILKSRAKCLLFYKGEGASRRGRLVSKKHFDNYEQFISSASLIFIPQKFEYRVSGVFFESIASSKAVIIMSDCTYSRAMRNIFKDSVVMLEDLTDLDDGLSFALSINVDVNHRRMVVQQLEAKSSSNVKREFYGQM